jgi:hypothetical protein
VEKLWLTEYKNTSSTGAETPDIRPSTAAKASSAYQVYAMKGMDDTQETDEL